MYSFKKTVLMLLVVFKKLKNWQFQTLNLHYKRLDISRENKTQKKSKKLNVLIVPCSITIQKCSMLCILKTKRVAAYIYTKLLEFRLELYWKKKDIIEVKIRLKETKTNYYKDEITWRLILTFVVKTIDINKIWETMK